MKTQFFKTSLILLSLVFGLTATSCSNDDGDNPGGNTAAAGTVKATVDGQDFQSTDMTTSLTIIDSAGGGKTFSITATDLEGRNLTLQVTEGYVGEGTYEIGGDNIIFVVATWVVIDLNTFQPTTYAAPFEDTTVKGSMTITSDDGSNVQGNFEFVAGDGDGSQGPINTVNVTNGSFNLDY